MIDLDYNNKSNDYILDMFYGIEDEEFYIGIKYKDGSVSKYPFTIHNYNAIVRKMEKQYCRNILKFINHKIVTLIFESFRFFLGLLCFIVTNGLFFSWTDNILYFCCFFIISGLTFLITIIKRENKFLSLNTKEQNNVLAIDKYLKNKENFLIELANGDFTYGLNIANINGNTKEIPYNEEIKGQMKLLKYIAEKENSRDGLNG